MKTKKTELDVDFIGDGLQRRQVFHLFNTDDVRRPHDITNRQRRLVQPHVERRLRQDNIARARIVHRVEEAFHIK